MTGGLHGHAETLEDVASDLRDTEHVLEVRTGEDVYSYVETLIEWDGVPPSVSRVLGHSPFSLTGIDKISGTSGTFTVAIVRKSGRGGGQ